MKELSKAAGNASATAVVKSREKTEKVEPIKRNNEQQQRRHAARPMTAVKQASMQRPTSSILMRPQSSLSHLQKTQATATH